MSVDKVEERAEEAAPPLPQIHCDFSSTRPHVPAKNRALRVQSTRLWAAKVLSFSLLFRDHLLLRAAAFNHSCVLCVSAGAGQEVAALRLLGIDDVTGVEILESPPLVRRADPHNLPFFDGVFDLAFPARFDEALFAAEMERVIRPGGACVVLVAESGEDEVREVVGLFRNSRLVRWSNHCNVACFASVCYGNGGGTLGRNGAFIWWNFGLLRSAIDNICCNSSLNWVGEISVVIILP
ncbi:hypothetical protein HKD37_06G017527 [Glycine soja]